MKKLVWLLMIVGLVCAANAADIRYRESGSWNQLATYNAGTGQWEGIGWMSAALPGTSDAARANWGGWTGNTITLNYAAPTVRRLQLGVDESGTLEVNSGGSITATTTSMVGNNNWVTGKLVINTGGTVTNSLKPFTVAAGNGGDKPAGWDPAKPTATWGATYGIVEINGGTLNLGSHLWAATGGTHANSGGAPTSVATITINAGGVINVGGMIGLGTGDAVNKSAGGGTASLTVNDGGLLALTNIHAAGTSVFPGSMFFLNGSGRITLPGDFTGVMNTMYIPTYITGNGVLGNAQAVYANGITTVTAIPEPMTMALLGLGAMALLRKKK